MRKPVLIPALLAMITIALLSCSERTGELTARQGVIDLRSTDLTAGPPVTLSGEWEFYWNRFLSEEEMTMEVVPGDMRHVHVPHNWRGMDFNGSLLPGTGFATYRLKILLRDPAGNNDNNSLSAMEQLALKVPDAATAYRLFIDGKPRGSGGSPGTTASESVPREGPAIVRFNPPGPSFYITVHVSNFHHRNAGLWHNIRIGSNRRITSQRRNNLAFEFFLLGSLLIIAIYYLIMFLLRRQDRGYLFYSIFTFLVAFRNLVIDEKFLMSLLPGLSWEIFVKTAHLSVYLPVPFFLLFFKTLFPDEVRPWLIRSSAVITGIISSVVILMPVRSSYWTLNIFIIATLITIAAALYILSTAVIHKRKWSVMITVVTVFFSAIVIHDIMIYKLIIKGNNLLTLGWLLFILFHAYILSNNYARSFKDLELVSGVLAKNNEELARSLERLKSTQERIILNEKKAVVGSLAAGLAHEIRNQLSAISYLELIEDKFTDEEKAFIQYIYDSRDRIGSLVNEVRALAKSEEVHYSIQLLRLKDVIEEAVFLSKMDPDVRGVDIVLEHGFQGEIKINKNRIIQVFLNLIRNAAHALTGIDSGSITIKTSADKSFVEILVLDNGTGIDMCTLDSIWQPFFTTKGDLGTGIGLDISRRIIEGHNGTISCKSEPGHTVFIIHLPVPAGYEGL